MREIRHSAAVNRRADSHATLSAGLYPMLSVRARVIAARSLTLPLER